MSLDYYSQQLRGDFTLSHRLTLEINELTLLIESNSEKLIDSLTQYFRPLVTAHTQPDKTIQAIEGALDLSALNWTDWPREPGKTGRKEAFIDGDGYRLVHKVKTGACMLQTLDGAIIRGACTANDNQVINVINAQYLNHRQQQGDQLCHAAACQLNDITVAFAGFSGGGKSTLMLHCLSTPELKYLSNDRLLIEKTEGRAIARGIPKLPRVNPGTILNDENLRSMLSDDARQAYEALPNNELWDLEDKYDVMVDEVYGPRRLSGSGTLELLFILNWERASSASTEIHEIELRDRPDLLAAVMKSPGPFYVDRTGQPLSPNSPLDANGYLDALETVRTFEISGRVDFQTAQLAVIELLERHAT